MRVSIHNPSDEDYIQSALVFLSHVATCPQCYQIAKTGEAREAIASIFATLNALTPQELTPPDYSGAIEFCRYWLRINGYEALVDTEEETPTITH